MASKKRLLLSVASFFILVAISGIAFAQSSKEAEGEAAEHAGRLREALTNYTTALQATTPGSDAEQRLLERAATISSKVSPSPALPAEAERRLVRGQALVESARDADAFMRAAAEFRAALRAAPWLADAHYNLGIVLDKAQRFSEAIRSLKLSILAAPNAKEAGEAQRLIYRIEVRQEEAQRAKAEAERKALDAQRAEEQKQRAAEAQAKADEQLAARLVGIWRPSTLEATMGSKKLVMVRGYRIQIQVNGTKVTATCIGTPMANAEFTESWYRPCNLPYFEATVKGGRLVGTINAISYGSSRQGVDRTDPLNEKIEINADGTWFKLGDVDWDAWEGKDWTKFFGKEK